MQVKEINSEPLKKSFEIVIGEETIVSKTEERLKSLSKNVTLSGFRKGKVPMDIIRKNYGEAIKGEVIEEVIKDASVKVVKDNNLRPALKPAVDVKKFEDGKAIEYTMTIELMPEVPEVDFESIQLEKRMAEVTDQEVLDGIKAITDHHKHYHAASDDNYEVKNGDAVLADFVGKIDGVVFKGGTAQKQLIELGSGKFIPGFEDQIIGIKKNEERQIRVKFPENYGSEELNGKEATFDIKAHEIRVPHNYDGTDEFAIHMGFKDLATLKDAVRKQLEKDYQNITRQFMKKELFDILDERYQYDVPEGMVKLEFDSIWEQAKRDQEDKTKSEEEHKAEYQKMASRRVRLGIILSELARVNKIEVTQQELYESVMQAASRFPGEEKAVIQFYQKNPDQVEALKGPILEEKVVDYILSKVKLEEKKVTSKELVGKESTGN